MNNTRIVIYLVIALCAAITALYVLAKEPQPDWPINLIHLLFKH
jgi:hypothetical protein